MGWLWVKKGQTSTGQTTRWTHRPKYFSQGQTASNRSWQTLQQRARVRKGEVGETQARHTDWYGLRKVLFGAVQVTSARTHCTVRARNLTVRI